MPQQKIHETQPPQQPSATLISPELKKLLLPIVIGIIVSFGGSWFATDKANQEVRFQTQANKEAIVAQAELIKANAEALNQIVVSMARLSEAQSRIAQDLKELQLEQRAAINRQK